jgi:hypothetical protein
MVAGCIISIFYTSEIERTCILIWTNGMEQGTWEASSRLCGQVSARCLSDPDVYCRRKLYNGTAV